MDSNAALEKLVFPVNSFVCLLVACIIIKEKGQRALFSEKVLFTLLVCSKFRKKKKFCHGRCVILVYIGMPLTFNLARVIPLQHEKIVFLLPYFVMFW